MLDPHVPPPIRLAATAPLKRETELPRVVDAHQLMQVLAALAVRARAAAVPAGVPRFGVGARAVHVVHVPVAWNGSRGECRTGGCEGEDLLREGECQLRLFNDCRYEDTLFGGTEFAESSE